MSVHLKLPNLLTLRFLGLASALLLITILIGPASLNAQGTSAAVSFDPTVNPLLIENGAKYAAGWSDTRAPQTGIPDRPGSCKNYSISGSVVAGCADNGVFTLYLPGGAETGGSASVDSAGGSTAEPDQTAGGAAKGVADVLNCVSDPGPCIVNAVVGSMALIGGSIAYLFLIVGSFFLWLAGGAFNWIVIRTVFEFGSYFGTSDGLLIAWSIMRDIGNIVLLFGFIFMGIATILNTHALDEFSARKALPHLIIFAVLLNFSLFASQIVIDTANSFAAVFTAQAGLGECTSPSTVDKDACGNVGIAGNVMQMAGVSSIWDVVKVKEWGNFIRNPIQQAPVYIGLALFVIITAVVLLAGAIMLLIRAIVLVFLMITSPIGFAGMAIPPLQKLAKQWWHTLISQSFFAPVYLLLILISIKISSGLTGGALADDGSGTSLAAALIDGGTLGPQVIVLFAVVIGFMVASLMISKKMGAYGADYATKTAGGAVVGGMAFIGRRTGGRLAYLGAQGVRSSSLRNTGFGKAVAQTLDKGAKSSFDLRASGVKLPGSINLGTAQKGGYDKIVHDAEEDKIKYAKSLKNTGSEKQNIVDINEEIGKKAEMDRAELDALKAGQEAEQAPLREQLKERQKEVAEARALGDREALKTAELALNNINLEKAAMDRVQAEARQKMENEHKAWMDAQNKEIAKIKKAPQIEYADRIGASFSDRDLLGKAVFAYNRVLGGVGNVADDHAAHKIRDNAGKNDLEKALDSIKSEVEKSKGGDDHAKPATTATASTAAPAAATH